MPRLHDWWFRIKAALFPKTTERELDRELDFHLAMQTEQLEREGMPPAAARREAHRRFGTMAGERERIRDAWGIRWFREFLADLRHTMRQAWRRPGFSLLGVATLTIGIGATVAIFSVVRGLVLRPLPVAEEGGLHVFWSDYNWRGVEFDFVKERRGVFDQLAAFSTDGASLRAGEGSIAVLHSVVSAELFDVLGRAPRWGRTFRAGEDRPGAEATIVLSYGLWQDLGADSSLVGKRLLFGGVPTTVIGVMPRGFYFPSPEIRAWRPLNLDPASGQYQGNGWLVLIGRTKPGTAPERIRDGIASIAKALGERFTYPAAWDKTKGAHATPLRAYLLGDATQILLLLLGAVAMVLLMACANTAALVLARTTDRTDELTLRVALGAGTERLVRQIVTESLVLSVGAGLLGGLLAVGLFRVVVANLPLGTFGSVINVDWVTFAVAIALAVVVGLTVSALPVRTLLRGRLAGISGDRSAPSLHKGPGQAHATLVGIEVALAVMLATGSILFVRSVARLAAIDPGFDPNGVVAVDLIASPTELSEPTRRQFFRDVLTRAAATPGVDHAALTARLPIRDGGGQGPVEIEGNPDLAGPNQPNALYRPVTPDYFATLGIGIVKGRGFEPTDRAGTTPVAIVSESFARTAWPGQDPLGRRLRARMTADTTSLNVVGIAEEARLVRLTGDNPFVLYVPLEQLPYALEGGVLVAKSPNPDGAIAALRQVARAVDDRVPVARTTSLGAALAQSLAEPLRLRLLLSIFAGLALTLGAVGVYGVVSYAVARRRAEFGIRLALGAAPIQVMREVLRLGMRPVTIGAVAGLAGAAFLSRWVAGHLYGVSGLDMPSYLVGGGALVAAGFLASLSPGWRASQVDPVTSLRAE